MCSTGREEAELNWATLSALSSCTISGRFASVNILQCAANALPTLASPVRSIHSRRLVVLIRLSFDAVTSKVGLRTGVDIREFETPLSFSSEC